MKRKIVSCLTLAAFSVGLLIFLAGCGTRASGGVTIGYPPPPQHEPGPPPWAPAHGRRAKHKYRYYPDAGVYFNAGAGLYFYYSGGQWRVSARLPISINIGASSYVTLEMDTDKPYTYHGDVKKRYPPGQLKKKEKTKGKGKGKGKGPSY